MLMREIELVFLVPFVRFIGSLVGTALKDSPDQFATIVAGVDELFGNGV